MMAGMDLAYTFWRTSGNDADFKNLEVFMCMERETNAQKARRLLSEHGWACCHIQSAPGTRQSMWLDHGQRSFGKLYSETLCSW